MTNVQGPGESLAWNVTVPDTYAYRPQSQGTRCSCQQNTSHQDNWTRSAVDLFCGCSRDGKHMGPITEQIPEIVSPDAWIQLLRTRGKRCCVLVQEAVYNIAIYRRNAVSFLSTLDTE